MFELKRERLQQPDGAEWEVFDIDGGEAVLTSSGRELFQKRQETWRELRSYRKRAMGRAALRSVPVTREYFASGANSDVYTLNDDMVIKEAKPTGSLFYTVERMDRLLNVIQSSVPRWIDIPTHYGLLNSRNLNRQYLLMEKIDSGITVEQILQHEHASDREKDNIQKEFGTLTDQDVREVRERYELAEGILTDALASKGYDRDDYLTDWHEGNVLVEPLRTPVADSPLKLWVIDQ